MNGQSSHSLELAMPLSPISEHLVEPASSSGSGVPGTSYHNTVMPPAIQCGGGQPGRPQYLGSSRRSSRSISVDYFDPQGVHTLTRELTRSSQGSVADAGPTKEGSRRHSETTLDANFEEHQDFERVLRYYLRKYACPFLDSS